MEEPAETQSHAWLDVSLDRATNVHVVVPHLPAGLSEQEQEEAQAQLLVKLAHEHGISNHVQWFYTPMALPVARALEPRARVYDCMDELSAFKGAPRQLITREAELLSLADVVFTGGHALFEAKRQLHPNIHPFPSSVDVKHFAQARAGLEDPADQREIPRPRLGFFGVIDERMDVRLLEEVARARPEWQLVLIGPVVKIDPADLPRLPNIHYLGPKSYAELPHYLSGWDVALLPFAKNEATRYISPTKTPEYLAAGRPVVSTSIRDVVRPYSVQGLARIADTPRDFVAACEAALNEPRDKLLRRADPFLSRMSWDATWSQMQELVDQVALPSSGRISGTQRVATADGEREVG